jgi:hypothetical protein
MTEYLRKDESAPIHRKYRITTTAELVDAVTDENVDALLRDLEQWLKWHLAVRAIPQDLLPVTMDTVFVWTDDGNPGAGRVTVIVDSEKSEP